MKYFPLPGEISEEEVQMEMAIIVPIVIFVFILVATTYLGRIGIEGLESRDR